MKLEIKVPSVGESVSQGILSAWLKKEGDAVEEGADLFELETDKATVTVPAPASGTLSILIQPGTEVTIGQVVGSVDSDGIAARPATPAAAPSAATQPTAAKPAAPQGAAKAKPAPVPPAPAPAAPPAPRPSTAAPGAPKPAPVRPVAPLPLEAGAGDRREPMSTLRRKIAERLVQAHNATAALTTFNEVNMQRVMDLRSRYRDEFERVHGVKLGFMSFFIKSCCMALREMPLVNARIEGEEIVFQESADIGVAVATDRGLIVPVLRGAQRLGLAGIEAAVADLAARARDRKILPDELSGGTFSITNGGVFGSLLSTPLLNYPQSAILGMHTIQQRPVAENGQVVIRPMMYVALTYDHRLIDGREAVTFLRRIKDLVEDPYRLLIEA